MKKKSLNIITKFFNMKNNLEYMTTKILNIYEQKFLNINFHFGLDKQNQDSRDLESAIYGATIREIRLFDHE